MSQIITKHTGGMAFDTVVDGHTVTIDADPDFGGQDNGPKPKPLLLLSLSGCTGMDVVSLMNKMRVEYADFEVKVDGVLAEEHPKYYTKIHVTYSLKTKPEYHEKVKKAVNLSQDRYCGISYMITQSSELTHEIDFQEL